MVAKHRKVHLFDIDIPGRQTFKVSVRHENLDNLRQQRYRTQAHTRKRTQSHAPQESDSLTPGTWLTSFEAPFGKIGLGICYDIVSRGLFWP